MGRTTRPARHQSTGALGVVATRPDDEPVLGPSRVEAPVGSLPRLARHTISLADGQQVGVSVCGRGVPIVLIHGFTAEGMLYAQTLSRIVTAGFKVVAIDVANHGSSQGLPTGGSDFHAYAKLLGRVVDELGIRKAVFAGHSMGGRLVTELAAREPERALAVFLLDAIVGEPWDRIVAVCRFNPFLLAGIGAVLAVDSVSTVPFLRNPSQALKLGHLIAPTLRSHARHPTHLIGPGISILRSHSSKGMLEKLGRDGVPLVAIHGDRDIVVPLSTARSAAKLAKGMVVVVEGGTHSWLLKDPETLPAILREVFEYRRSEDARAEDFAAMGLAPDASLDEIEAAFYEPDAAVLALTPAIDLDEVAAHLPEPTPPRYHWHVDIPE